MTLNQIENIISEYLAEAEIEINCVKVEGFRPKNKTIKRLEISLDGLSIYNILEEIKIILDDFEHEYNINIESRYIEF
jgi:hypothetical protein